MPRSNPHRWHLSGGCRHQKLRGRRVPGATGTSRRIRLGIGRTAFRSNQANGQALYRRKFATPDWNELESRAEPKDIQVLSGNFATGFDVIDAPTSWMHPVLKMIVDGRRRAAKIKTRLIIIFRMKINAPFEPGRSSLRVWVGCRAPLVNWTTRTPPILWSEAFSDD
jgi:hypothetical protein